MEGQRSSKLRSVLLTLLSPRLKFYADKKYSNFCTGTTLILIATDAYKKYLVATGATFDSATGLLTITLAEYNNLQNLVFTTPDGVHYTLIPNAQIWPRSLNANIGGTPGSIYLIIGDIGSNSGQGLDFINGFAFLQRFYSVYDTGNRRVGLATTPFTTSTAN